MKNSALGQAGIKSSVRRSVSILLVFAAFAVSNNAKAADSKNLPFDGRTNVQLLNASDRDSTALAVSERGPEAGRLDPDPSFQQMPAPWCYTNYGRFPMLVALPPGYVCSVNLPYWPFVVTGITGY